MAKPEINWADIRADWVSTDKSLRDLSSEYGVPEATIRHRAKKELWGPRNAPKQMQARVNAALAGVAHPVAQCATSTDEAMANAVDEAVQDMRLGADVGRSILKRIQAWLQPDEEGNVSTWQPKDLKVLAEGARCALETIRRARNLDEPGKDAPLLEIDWGAVVARR